MYRECIYTLVLEHSLPVKKGLGVVYKVYFILKEKKKKKEIPRSVCINLQRVSEGTRKPSVFIVTFIQDFPYSREVPTEDTRSEHGE